MWTITMWESVGKSKGNLIKLQVEYNTKQDWQQDLILSCGSFYFFLLYIESLECLI